LTWGRATSHIQHMIDPNISAKSKLSSTKNSISHTYCLPLTLQWFADNSPSAAPTLL
jgi:hypothetical protein